jgi:hypothetical protein
VIVIPAPHFGAYVAYSMISRVLRLQWRTAFGPKWRIRTRQCQPPMLPVLNSEVISFRAPSSFFKPEMPVSPGILES